MQFKLALLSLFSVALTIVNGQSITPNLTSILSSTPELSSLNGLVLGKPALVDRLMNWPTNLTIVAPSNGAFEELKKMDTTARNSIPMVGNSIDTVEAILSYHVLNGLYPSSSFIQGNTTAANTLLVNNSFANLPSNTPQVLLGRNDDTVTLYSGLGMAAKVERADIPFNNGVIHIIDR